MRPRRASIALSVAFAVLVAGPAAAHAASTGVVAGKLTGTTIPAKSRGVGFVRALGLGSGVIAGSVRSGSKGAYRMKLAPGAYAVLGAVLDRRSKSLATRAGPLVSLRAGQRRSVPVAVRKVRKRKTRRRAAKRSAHAAYVQESGKDTPGVIAYQVDDITGLKGDVAYLNSGIWWMVAGDMTAGGSCPTAQIANARERRIIEGELDLQKSKYFDPATRVKRDFIIADIRVRGRLRNTPGGAAYVFEIRNARTGGLIATKTGEVRFDSGFFSQVEAIGPALIELICHPPKAPAPAPVPPATDPDGLTGTFTGDVDLATGPAPVPIRISWTGTLDLERQPYGINPSVVYVLRAGSLTATITGTIGDCAVNGSTPIDLVASSLGQTPPVVIVELGAAPSYRVALQGQLGNVIGIKSGVGCSSPGEQVPWPLLGIGFIYNPTPQTSGSRFAFNGTLSGPVTPGDVVYHWTWALSGPRPG